MSPFFPFNEIFRAPLIQLIPRAFKFRSTFDALRTRSYEKFLFYVWSRWDYNSITLSFWRTAVNSTFLIYICPFYSESFFSLPSTLSPQSSLQTHSDVNEHWIKHLLVRRVLLLFRYILMQVLRGLLGVKYRVTNKVILLLHSAELFIHRAWRIIALRGGGGGGGGGGIVEAVAFSSQARIIVHAERSTNYSPPAHCFKKWKSARAQRFHSFTSFRRRISPQRLDEPGDCVGWGWGVSKYDITILTCHPKKSSGLSFYVALSPLDKALWEGDAKSLNALCCAALYGSYVVQH